MLLIECERTDNSIPFPPSFAGMVDPSEVSIYILLSFVTVKAIGALSLLPESLGPVSTLSDQRPEGVDIKRPDVEFDTSFPCSIRIKVREFRVAMRVLAYLSVS